MTLEFVENGELVIQADLPGLDPDRDIAISIVHDVLRIRVRSQERAVDHISDLRDGAYERDIALPPGTTESRVRAAYRAGQLEVRAPVDARVSVDSIMIPIDHD